MKALLLKDCYVLYKQLRYLLIVLVIFCIMPGPFASAFSVIYAVMLPVTTISFDVQSKWDQLSIMMPYKPSQLVFSKYLLGYLATAAAFLLSVLTQLAVSALRLPLYEASPLLSLFVFPFIGLLLLSVNLPLVFRFGPEKGRLVYIVACGLIGACAAIIPQDFVPQFDPLPIAVVFLIITPILQWISYNLSLKFFSMEKV